MAAGRILSSFAAPAPPHGLCWDGYSLWMTSHPSNTFYQLSTDGTVKKVFAHLGPHIFGVTFDGLSLWVNDSISQLIYKIDPETGHVKNTPIAMPFAGAYDLAWIGNALLTGAAPGLYYINPYTGESIALTPPLSFLIGIEKLGADVFIGTDTVFRNDIFIFSCVTGEIINSIPEPAADTQGIAYDGRNLWVADYQSQTIFQVSAN